MAGLVVCGLGEGALINAVASQFNRNRVGLFMNNHPACQLRSITQLARLAQRAERSRRIGSHFCEDKRPLGWHIGKFSVLV